MASSRKSDEEIHTTLLVNISELIDATSEDFVKLKLHIESTRKVKRAESSTLKTPLQLFDTARRRGVFPVGNNDYLRRYVEEINLDEALELISKAEEQMGIKKVQKKEIADSVSRKSPEECLSLHSNVQDPPEAAATPEPEYGPPLRYFSKEKANGYVLIINNFTDERIGSNHDVKNLTQFFKNTLGYNVSEKQNVDKDNLETTLTSLQVFIQNQMIECNMLIIIILSHGDEKGIKTCKNAKEEDGQRIKVDEIVSFFKCDKVPVLAGLPKLFFIQACRGNEDMYGMDIADDKQREPSSQLDDSRIPTKLSSPTDADILIFYSTTPGYRSFRREDSGSWFIRELIGVFNKYYTRRSLQSMLTITSYIIASYEANTDTTEKGKQVPCVVSTLLKDLYFT